MTDTHDKAIEAAARAYAGADADRIIYNGYGENLGPRWQAEVPGIRAAIAAYEAALWQPIETAPTDETPVLVWDGRTVSEDIYAPSVRGRRGAKEGHRTSVKKWRPMPQPPGGEG